jgi:hypothetical protein
VIPWDIGRYLVKKDDKTNYLVDMVALECSCDDFLFRKRVCKHQKYVIEHIKLVESLIAPKQDS